MHEYIQCVSLDSPSFIIYPEINATEVAFPALKSLLQWPLFQDNETNLGESKRNTLYIHKIEMVKDAEFSGKMGFFHGILLELIIAKSYELVFFKFQTFKAIN